ncbi:MAG: cation-translocating P-type ATPase [Oscillospiraceae bacterium]|nr:cation-translocating P-type ATPase [Oscillospiraceae bacterium]
MQHYLETAQDVFDHVKSTAQGLTKQDAADRLAENGPNKLKEGKKESLLVRFLKQMTDPMIIILLAAAGISAVLAVHEKEFPADVIIILVVVLINAILGVYQESKAEAAIEALQEMSAATTRAIRGGEVAIVPSAELVVGDVILLEAGDAVPADARVFEAASLKIEEAALTGESVPTSKLIGKLLAGANGDVALGDRKNMVYMGSSVAYGRGRAVVVATGMDTEMGKIADAIEQAEEGQTPLQIKLSQLSKILTWLVLGICLFIFGFDIVNSLLHGKEITFTGLLDVFMVAVSLAVAAIPEGLAAVVTIVLSIGVTNMSKKKAIIRRLTAVETLGCAQIICSDKTGTLTQNKMTVVETYVPSGDADLLATAMALCTDAELVGEGEDVQTVGEPTEVALVNFAYKSGLSKNELKKELPRVCEAPFDSMRKMMSTVHEKTADSNIVQYTKGAPDEILRFCTQILAADGIRPITDPDKDEIRAANKKMADQALRVLAAAQKTYTEAPEQGCEAAFLEQEMCFIGLTGMIDPERPEVADAVAECRKAGIRPIMITGDHKDTAVAIARKLGILEDGLEAITGAELDGISEEDFEERIKQIAVYARVQPEHKTRIVNVWRKLGNITAMTGDGVNDAPSIKSADIGVGMGITGTDVTKNVADMVLADDNFATIVSAVGEGRRIYTNIRKAIQFLLGSNLSEVISIFTASLLSITILKPVHLLWINLVTDCFPALALGMEKPEHNIMQQKPRNARDGVFAGGVGIDVCYQGIMVSALTIGAWFAGVFLHYGSWDFLRDLSAIPEGINAHGMILAFLVMNMAEIFHSFNMRSQRGSLFVMTAKSGMNWWMVGSLVIAFALTCAVLFIPPLRVVFFGPETIVDAQEFGVGMALAFAVIPIVEVVKFFQRLAAKAKKS